MKEEPVTHACAGLLSMREHVVVGISPFNSYFSEEKIKDLVSWAKETFSAFHVYVPDGPAVYTLQATGYSEAQARKKAARQGRWLCNKIARAMSDLGIGACEQTAAVLNSNRLDADPAYQRLHDEAWRLYDTDGWFREGCLQSSRWVLDGKIGDPDELTSGALEDAVRYFLAELPLFIDSAGITGARSSVFAYHQCPAFLAALLQDRRGEIISARQGFVKVGV